MDFSSLREALEKARLIVASHGMINYMPSYSRQALSRPITDYNDRVSFNFLLYPSRPNYDSANFSCFLNVAYQNQVDVERDGGIYRDYILRVSIRMETTDLSLELIKTRENMVQSIVMLAEMIENLIPKNVTITVTSPDELKEKRQIEHEQKIAEQIFVVVGKECIRNLRIGKKAKLSRIPEKYFEIYKTMPEPGKYRFNQTRSVNRRGYVKDRASFTFVVTKSWDNSYLLKAYRIS